MQSQRRRLWIASTILETGGERRSFDSGTPRCPVLSKILLPSLRSIAAMDISDGSRGRGAFAEALRLPASGDLLPSAPSGAVRSIATARWAAGIFLLVVVLQRFAIPGTPVALLIPAIIIWCAIGLARRLVVFDQTRLTFWVAAAGITATAMPLQSQLVQESTISLGSWGLFMIVWLPFTLRLVERSNVTYLTMLRYVTIIATCLGVLCILMIGSALAGLPYRDWFGEFVPISLQLTDFVITYPISYGSSIYRANAWIGLEPSMVSAQLGLGLLAAIFTRAKGWIIIILVIALATTVSGSGVAIAGVGLVVMMLHRSRRLVLRYAPVAVAAGIAASLTTFGSLLLQRTNEIQQRGSSASLRALEPYSFLYPNWISDLAGLILGYGPGSSQRIITDSGIMGLLVPTPIKIFFEYGLFPGAILAAFLLVCYWGGPSRAFGISLLVSLWALQPGTTTMVIVAPLLALVTLWSPRVEMPIEDIETPKRSRRLRRSLAAGGVNTPTRLGREG